LVRVKAIVTEEEFWDQRRVREKLMFMREHAKRPDLMSRLVAVQALIAAEAIANQRTGRSAAMVSYRIQCVRCRTISVLVLLSVHPQLAAAVIPTLYNSHKTTCAFACPRIIRSEMVHLTFSVSVMPSFFSPPMS